MLKVKTTNRRIMVPSNWTICGSKKSRFIDKQEAGGLLSSLGIRAPVSQISFVGLLLF